jgi:diguanylate cyclase (GGDEF)-like protein
VFDARKLETELQRELARAQRYKRPVAITVIEATNLRLLRERFGRFLTDRLLQRLGEALAQHARDIDVLGAYKQSGFTMILTEASVDGASKAAQRLLKVAQEARLDGEERVPGLELHLVVGHASSPKDGTTTDALFAAAEKRMYGGSKTAAA